MAIYKIINTTSTQNPNYELSVNLDGSNFILRFDWIERWERWCINVYTDNRIPILLGHALVTNYTVGMRVKNPKMWKGTMYVISDGSHVDPNLTNMNMTGPIQLAYKPITGNN